MENIEQIDSRLYRSMFGKPKVGDYKQIWSEIRKNKEMLQEAVKVKRNKWDTGNILEGMTIAHCMLIEYNKVDKEAYNELINNIYNDTDIARLVVDGASNGGYSFLLMSLWNHKLNLTEEQKAYAVDEAMNKIGTTRWQQKQEIISKKLEEKGISDDKTTLIDIDGCVNPVGQKTGTEYVNYMFSSLSNTQAHGIGEFDIRYCILRNPNWTLEEKQKLIMDFWCDEEEYRESLREWEWAIINDPINSKGSMIFLIDREELYDYTYEMLLKIYQNEKYAKELWEEIEFCRQMKSLRSDKITKQKVLV